MLNTNSIQEAKLNILLIEDNPGDAKLVEIYLRDSPNFDFELTHVLRLRDGLAFAEAGNTFDIVLLDLSLPDSAGFDTLNSAMKGFPSSVSIVVLTGLDDEVNGVKAVELGAQDYLVKGQIDTSTLTRSVLHAVQRRKMQLQVEQTAKNLTISEQRLLQAQRIAKIGNYEWIHGESFMYWSQEISRILGLSEEREPTLDNFLELIVDEERAKVRGLFEGMNANTEPFSFEHRLVANDSGTRKYLRNQGKVEVDDNGKIIIVGTLQDITDYKHAEQMFMLSEERYTTIFQESQDSIFFTTSDGRIAEQNESLATLTGYSAEDFPNLRLTDFFKNKEQYDKFIKTIEEEGSIKDFEFKLLTKVNSIVECTITSTQWQKVEGVSKGYHGIIRDITALKRTQELIKDKKIAEQSAMLKEQFLANMSHEIRTPMNVVVGMTHLLESTSPSTKQSEYINALKLSSDTLLRLINNILDFSKIESGKLILEQHPFRIQELMQDLVQQYKYKSKEKGIDLFTVIDVNLPETVLGDYMRLHQVLNNLVSNAIKYTDTGEILLQAKLLSESSDSVNISFSVKDSGIGIPPEKQERIFEVFEQASNDTSRLYGGTGLGLSIVKKLVNLFDGDIAVKSAIGFGSTFSFNVVFKKNENDSAENINSANVSRYSESSYDPMPTSQSDVVVYTANELTDEELSANYQPGSVEILLVEDHKFNQIVATELLKKWSANTIPDVAENGKEAIEMLNKKSYDIILMDISMPIMDGYATTEYIRNEMESPIKDIPIIAMTAHAFNKNAERCFEVGMNEFISKPIKPAVLYAKLNKVLAAEGKILKAEELGASKQQVKNEIKQEELAPASVSDSATNFGENTKRINLEYLDSLSGGDTDLKISMIETIVNDLPSEVEKVIEDNKNKDWNALKKSAHKMKATTAYMGLAEMSEVAKTIENNAWEGIELDKIGSLVSKLSEECMLAHKELENELSDLKTTIQ